MTPSEMRASIRQMPGTYSGPFRDAVEETIGDWERGFAADPDDRGGPTVFGISTRSYPEEFAGGKRPDLRRAMWLYERDFWLKHRLPVIAGIDERLARKVFNFLVHSEERACGILQFAANEIRVGTGARELELDCVFGAKTAARIEREIAKRGSVDRLLAAYCGFQFDYYCSIWERRPSQRKYAANWSLRARWLPGDKVPL